ncbi:unnamed protein product [Boreogadus saida]
MAGAVVQLEVSEGLQDVPQAGQGVLRGLLTLPQEDSVPLDIFWCRQTGEVTGKNRSIESKTAPAPTCGQHQEEQRELEEEQREEGEREERQRE